MHKAAVRPDNAATLHDGQLGSSVWTRSQGLNPIGRNKDRRGDGTSDAPTYVV